MVGTEPKATSNVAKGSSVKLLLSSGQVAVPNVTGKSFTEADAILRKLLISVVREDEPSDQPEGTVLSQNLPEGTKVDAGNQSITLKVASPQAVEPTPTPTTEPSPTEGMPSPTPTP